MAVALDALDREWVRSYRHPNGPLWCPAWVRSVLVELLEHPGRCTTELGACDAVHGQGNASNLLPRLERLELAVSEEEPRGPEGGRPRRRWRLTTLGARLARLAGQ